MERLCTEAADGFRNLLGGRGTGELRRDFEQLGKLQVRAPLGFEQSRIVDCRASQLRELCHDAQIFMVVIARARDERERTNHSIPHHHRHDQTRPRLQFDQGAVLLVLGKVGRSRRLDVAQERSPTFEYGAAHT